MSPQGSYNVQVETGTNMLTRLMVGDVREARLSGIADITTMCGGTVPPSTNRCPVRTSSRLEKCLFPPPKGYNSIVDHGKCREKRRCLRVVLSALLGRVEFHSFYGGL